MKDSQLVRHTQRTPKANRTDPKVRLFEEAILRLRGRWPAMATALCTDLNRLYGFGIGGKAVRERLVESRVEETLRLVEALYGPAKADEVRRSAQRPIEPIAV